MKKKVFYWAPFISEVGTTYAVINSAKSLVKYSKIYEPVILNVIGEWDDYYKEFNDYNIEVIDFTKIKLLQHLPKFGFLKSRISYVIIFIFSFFILYKKIKSLKPDILMCHLMTSVPIILFNLFNFESKLILRISGYPKLNFFRKILWKLSNKKIDKVFCPSNTVMNLIKKYKIFDNNIVYFLPDPVLDIKKINKLKTEVVSEEFLKKKSFILSIGRLTYQKNFSLLLDAFSQISKKISGINLVIIGDGEDKEKLLLKAKGLNIDKNVFFLGYKKNVFKYIVKSDVFILTSLWEDPGFVLIEAAYCNVPIISSNCPTSTEEILEYGKGGILYQNNNSEDLIKKINLFYKLNKNKITKMKSNIKKKIKIYTIHSHYLFFKKNINCK
jgi:glycosyltransferase involved in cell wall biosynthesis